MGISKYAAKKFVGEQVNVTIRKNKTEFLQMDFPSYEFSGLLESIDDFGLVIKGPSGMKRVLPFCDEYFKIENIE